jgi:hypothetical protein
MGMDFQLKVMRITRIIFIVPDRFSKRSAERFGIQRLLKRGFHVEVWECSSFFQQVLPEECKPPDLFFFSGSKLFPSEKLLLNAIQELTSKDIVLTDLGGLEVKTRKIYKQISKKGVPWGAYLGGQIPISVEEKSFWDKLQRLHENPISAINFFIKKLPVSWFKFRPFSFLLVGGTAPYLSSFPGLINSDTDILIVNSFDYDLHLEKRELGNFIKSEHVVFLDACGPFHPDYSISNFQFPCSVEDYYGYLNRIFKIIEDKFDCDVVIAAHPKSNYEKMPNIFQGRKVVRGETHDLVKNSKFVLSSQSTAMHFAVIYKKPILFLAINPHRKNELDLKIESMASKVGKAPLYWTGENSINLEGELEIDKNMYSKFSDDYIKKSGSLDQHSWDIFADYVDSL